MNYEVLAYFAAQHIQVNACSTATRSFPQRAMCLLACAIVQRRSQHELHLDRHTLQFLRHLVVGNDGPEPERLVQADRRDE